MFLGLLGFVIGLMICLRFGLFILRLGVFGGFDDVCCSGLYLLLFGVLMVIIILVLCLYYIGLVGFG